MSIFALFKHSRDADTPPVPPEALHPRELAHVSYAIAHKLLPHFAFEDFGRFIETWNDKEIPPGFMLYALGSKHHNLPFNATEGRKFSPSSGSLDATHDYYLLEFPEPPAPNCSPDYFASALKGGIEAQLAKEAHFRLPLAQRPLLAPLMAAVLHNRATDATSYYLLEQTWAPGYVAWCQYESDYRHANLGRYPKMSAGDFLAKLRTHVAGTS